MDLEKGNGLLVGRLGGLEKGRTLKEGRNERGVMMGWWWNVWFRKLSTE